MIDRHARDIAAGLVRQFRDGLIDNDSLANNWPSGSRDLTLRALDNMLWRYYDDFKVAKLVGLRAPTPEMYADLSRFALFLDSDLPYEWPRIDFDRIGGVGRIAIILSLGLGWLVDRRIRRRNEQLDAELRRAGDYDVWPFIRRADFEATQTRFA